jgi:hypothetical protein
MSEPPRSLHTPIGSLSYTYNLFQHLLFSIVIVIVVAESETGVRGSGPGMAIFQMVPKLFLSDQTYFYRSGYDFLQV